MLWYLQVGIPASQHSCRWHSAARTCRTSYDDDFPDNTAGHPTIIKPWGCEVLPGGSGMAHEPTAGACRRKQPHQLPNQPSQLMTNPCSPTRLHTSWNTTWLQLPDTVKPAINSTSVPHIISCIHACIRSLLACDCTRLTSRPS